MCKNAILAIQYGFTLLLAKHVSYLVLIWRSWASADWLGGQGRRVTLQSVPLAQLMSCVTACLGGVRAISSPTSDHAVVMTNGWERGFGERNLVLWQKKREELILIRGQIGISSLNWLDLLYSSKIFTGKPHCINSSLLFTLLPDEWLRRTA